MEKKKHRNLNSLSGGKYFSVQRMMYISVLVAQALVMFWLESQLPSITLPGAKLGLANIFTLVAIYTLDPISSFIVVFIRVLLSTLIAKSAAALLYSMTGALLSYVVMFLIKNLGRDTFSRISVSIAGAAFHNFGQVMMASLVLHNARVMYYLPPLALIAVPTGLFVGLTGNFMINHIKKLGIYRSIVNTGGLKNGD